MEHHDRDPGEIPAEDLAEAGIEPPDDIEVPEGDALAQGQEVRPGERRTRPSDRFDAPEADARDQAMEVPGDDDGTGYEG